MGIQKPPLGYALGRQSSYCSDIGFQTYGVIWHTLLGLITEFLRWLYMTTPHYWKYHVVLEAEVVMMTNASANIGEKVINMTNFPLQCWNTCDSANTCLVYVIDLKPFSIMLDNNKYYARVLNTIYNCMFLYWKTLPTDWSPRYCQVHLLSYI